MLPTSRTQLPSQCCLATEFWVLAGLGVWCLALHG